MPTSSTEDFVNGLINDHSGNRLLTGLAADLVDARVERHVAAERLIDAERAGYQGRREDVEPGEQPVERQRRGDLGAVQERQALLGASPEAGSQRFSRRIKIFRSWFRLTRRLPTVTALIFIGTGRNRTIKNTSCA